MITRSTAVLCTDGASTHASIETHIWYIRTFSPMPLHGLAAVAETFDVDVLLSFDCGVGVGADGDGVITNGIKGFCSVNAAFLFESSHLYVSCEQYAEQHWSDVEHFIVHPMAWP